MSKTFDELIELATQADNDDRPATVVESLRAASTCGAGLSSRYELMLADNLRAVGRIAEAKRVMREIKEFPENKAWLVNVQRGKIEHDAGNFQGAAYCLETAVEQNPNSTVPYVYLASADSAMEQYEKAIEVLMAGLAAEGDRDEVYLNLGYKYRAIGRYQEAQEALQNALKETPDYEEAAIALRDVISALEILQEGVKG
jgi:tetratricopeptide (TPR) repeat protein